ncbi:hypothetical protein [Nocardioides sambongensis]|nr:hypothetical protein [Nocardioides sambongensis]
MSASTSPRRTARVLAASAVAATGLTVLGTAAATAAPEPRATAPSRSC